MLGIKEEQKKREFLHEVGRICASFGGVRLSGTDENIWELETSAGLLRISPMAHGPAPWIACHFLDPARAVLMVDDVQAYSGRWNFHLWSNWERAEAIDWSPALSKGLKFFEARLKAVC